MAPRLLTLPGELKFHILKQLSPATTTSSNYECDDYQTLAEDVEDIFKSVLDVKNLAQSCKEMRSFFSDISYRGVQLIGVEGHKRFLEDLDNGTLPANISDRPNTKYLCFGRFTSHDHDCEELCCAFYERDHTIKLINRIFTHFSSITLLELINFPLSIGNIYAMSPLRALQTLSIIDPDPEAAKDIFTDKARHSWPTAPLTNLSVVISDIRACSSTSNAFKVFAERINTLSLKSDEARFEDPDKKLDFLKIDSLFLENSNYIRFTKLKHLSIGYMKMSTYSFRNFVTGCKCLESLSVNCRGMERPLPLFYVFDLIDVLTGESDDQIDMMGYDWLPENIYADMGMQPGGPLNPYITGSKIWMRDVASFTCHFARLVEPQPSLYATKTTKYLEIVLDSSTGADMKFEDLTEAFHDRSMSFQRLESLSIEMSNGATFRPSESENDLTATVLQMHRRDLSSVTEFHVRWGETEMRLDYSTSESD